MFLLGVNILKNVIDILKKIRHMSKKEKEKMKDGIPGTLFLPLVMKFNSFNKEK